MTHPHLSDLQPEERERELYSRIGRAVQEAQIFESALAGVMGFHESIAKLGESGDTDVLRRIDHWKSQTLGRVLKALREKPGGIPDSAFETLDGTIKLRNRLMHRFFAEHFEMGHLDSHEGWQLMVDEADYLRDLFAAGTQWLSSVSAQILATMRHLARELASEDSGSNGEE